MKTTQAISTILPAALPALACCAAIALTSCQSHTGTGALAGAAAGALIGAAAGDDEDDIAEGALAGAVLGGAAGAYSDYRAKRWDPANYPQYGGDGQVPYQQQIPQQQQPQQPFPQSTPQYPTATRTQRPGEVISPWPPNGVVDVRGFRSGELVEDPHTSKPFRVP